LFRRLAGTLGGISQISVTVETREPPFRSFRQAAAFDGRRIQETEMRDFWFDLASSISAEAFHVPRLAFKPTLLQMPTPPVAHASTHAAHDSGQPETFVAVRSYLSGVGQRHSRVG
jgi:hypothetical protein